MRMRNVQKLYFYYMNRESIENQMGLLVQIVRCIQMKKVLSEIDPDPKLNFWRLIHGSFMDLPALDWCKIFGSDAEPTHWKTVNSDHNEFRESLLGHLKISEKEWADYWGHMKDFRDKLVAHHSSNTSVDKYPEFDIALRSSYFYYDHLRNILAESNSDPIENLESYSLRFYEQAREIAVKAIEATNEINERVY
jgi:hypothetical protein